MLMCLVLIELPYFLINMITFCCNCTTNITFFNFVKICINSPQYLILMTIPIKSYFQIYGSFIPPCIVPKPSKTYYVDFVFDIMIASDILQINKKPSRNCKDMAKIIQKNEASLHAFYLRKLFKIYRYKTFSIKKTRLDNFYDSSRPSDTEWKKFIKMLVEKKIADEFENGEKLKFNFSDFKTKTLLPFEFIYEKIQKTKENL